MSREGRTFDVISEGIASDAPDDDVAGAFEDWRKNLGDTEAPGKIQAYRIPLDEHGRASHSATGQIRLNSWPIDQYDFDSLCQIIMKDYMFPGEKVMAVRLIGTLTGTKGIRFNKIIQLQRTNQTAVVPVEGKGGMAEVVKAMQESNERMLKLIADMGGTKTGTGQDEMMRTVAMMTTLMKPMQDLMAPILAAAIGRPATAGPSSSLKDTMESMILMERFLGRRGGGGGERRSDFAEIATAVSGVAKPLLEMAAANAQANLRQRRKALPAPAPVPEAAGQPAAPVQASHPSQTPAPVILPMDMPSQIQTPDMKGHNINDPTIVPKNGDSEDTMFAEMKKQVDALVQVASDGANAVGVADLFYDQTMATLPDDVYGQLAGMVEDTTFLAKLAIFNSKVQAHTEWFQKFREQLVKRIVEADPEESPQ